MRITAGPVPVCNRLHLITLAVFGLIALGKYVYVQTSGILVSTDGGLLPICAVILLLGAVCIHRGYGLAGLTLNTVGLLFLALSTSGASAALILRTGRDFGFIDDWLGAADALLGFNWPEHVAWAMKHPRLIEVLRHAYLAILWQPLLLILFLIARRDVERIYGLMHAMVLSLIVAGAVACFFPALGPWSFYGIDEETFAAANLVTNDDPIAAITWLRSSLTDPMPDMGLGLIYFPSYHAVSATIYTWAAWRTPVVRWVVLALNTAMLMATPLHGSHYLTDVVAGLAVAALTIWLVRRAVSRAMQADPALRRRSVGAPVMATSPA